MKRLPLTSDLLARCICTLRSGYLSSHIDKVLESMFLLAFYGFLRCSEFTAPSHVYQPTRHAFLSDISIQSADTLIFHLKLSKTNQFGQPQPINLFRLDSFLSPYEPICNYVTSILANQASPQDPLFISETGQVATRFWFHHHFCQILSRSGIPRELYSGHSFRIGAASTASRQGIPDHTIKNPRPLSSPAYLTNICHNLNDIRNAHTHLSASLLGDHSRKRKHGDGSPTQSLGFPNSPASHRHQTTLVHQPPPSSCTLQPRLPFHPFIPPSLCPSTPSLHPATLDPYPSPHLSHRSHTLSILQNSFCSINLSKFISAFGMVCVSELRGYSLKIVPTSCTILSFLNNVC